LRRLLSYLNGTPRTLLVKMNKETGEPHTRMMARLVRPGHVEAVGVT
jgi:chorismate synthase